MGRTCSRRLHIKNKKNTMEKRQINNTANQDDNTLGNEKIVRRHKVVNTWSYKIMDRIAKIMDHYYLDPLLGLVPGGWGDLISSIMVLPFVWFSLCVVKSVPLTLAVIYNAMLDAVKGLLPFFVGDVLDVFNHSYVRNMRLVQGFVYDDQDVVREVKRKAWFFAAAIVLFIVLIVLLVRLAVYLFGLLF